MLKLNSLPIVIKIGVLFFALAAILAAGIGVSSYRVSSAVIREAQQNKMEIFNGILRSHVYTFMDNRRESLALTLEGGGIDKFLSGGGKAALQAYLKTNSRGFSSVSYFSPEGNLQGSTSGTMQSHVHRNIQTSTGPGQGYNDKLLYCETLKAFVLELVYSSLISAKPKGSLKAYIELDSLGKEIADLNIGQSIFFIITTQGGDILYAPDKKMTALNILRDGAGPEIVSLIKTGEGAAQGILNGKLCFALVKTVPQYNWRITAAIPAEHYTAPLERVKRGILLFSLLIGAVSVFAGLVAAYILITRPVSALTKAVLDISENRNFEARVPSPHDDEIGNVARAFNSVLTELSGFHGKRLSKSEEKLGAAEAQLRQAQKMEIVGRLACGVAHDFNNLLTTILANCVFLLKDLPEGDPRRDDVKEIQGASERAATLTRQLLAFSRKQILQPRIIDLNASIADIQRIIKRLIGEDITIKTTLEPGLPSIKADPGQIEQIIMNLAVNARNAMPKGGVLHFKTASRQIPPGAHLEHSSVGLPPGNYTALTVTDTGTGMTETTMAHLFEPFFTTKEEGKGTGLGLAMVYGIVKQSGGFIDVKSAPGSGAVFTIYLPANAGPALPDAKKTEVRAGPLKNTGTILLVEDDEALLRVTSRILKGAGYGVIEAGTARAALGCLEKDFILLLTDIVLPDISGVDLASRVLKVKPGVPVIFTSGYSEDEAIREILSRPENSFIQKPFTNEALLRKIDEALG
ncbi:MAG: ATP-binding protein [Elusimicrobiota bacterium]|nr:ATP-binding protein [Elusimicrobiota bacterium]